MGTRERFASRKIEEVRKEKRPLLVADSPLRMNFDTSMNIQTLSVGPLQENCYLLLGDNQRGVIVDPGDEPERILAEMQRIDLKPQAILLTHAHFDHVGAVAPLVEALGLPVYLHPLDLELYRRSPQSAARWGLQVAQPPEPVIELKAGQVLDFGLGLEVLFVPGHSPGHVAFLGHGHLVGGDVLFRGGIGRYDLPGSNVNDLANSLKALMRLPAETVVWPGHGPSTTIGHEAKTNPYLSELGLDSD